ncbi:hypothetical protein EK21DRAFT_110799 [Setomelanomma holmii]|uniref:Uncharacterized protein n=1 Tax=Setomelanomma holmii TaxID=210430 RepID=A0A9P4HBR1_9PLEO|nr:hypothetical protein EK21DRAFT_110799 [Setomelanomma holmii]
MFLRHLISLISTLAFSITTVTTNPVPGFTPISRQTCKADNGKPGNVYFCTDPNFTTGCYHASVGECIGFQGDVMGMIRSIGPDPVGYCMLNLYSASCTGPQVADGSVWNVHLRCPGMWNIAAGGLSGMSMRCQTNEPGHPNVGSVRVGDDESEPEAVEVSTWDELEKLLAGRT